MICKFCMKAKLCLLFSRHSHLKHLGAPWKFCFSYRFLSSTHVSTIWDTLLCGKNQSQIGEGSEKGKIDIQEVRDALIQSKQPRQAVGGGKILPETVAKDFCCFYEKIKSKADKLPVFVMLAKDLGLNHCAIASLAKDIEKAEESGLHSPIKLEEKLQHSLEPPYIVLLSYIGRQEGGVKFIVDLRQDLLELLSDQDVECPRDELIAVNHNIGHLLSMWFSVGFLNIERVTWQSSCDITEKIASYEAVHEVRNWMDIKKRIGPYRRCYVFMHPSMPREPVCVLHVALLDEIPGSIQNILSEKIPKDELDVEKKNTAVFYSVTSTQRGLTEIDLGNSLIKKAVQELKHELPNIQTFITLSPIPSFYKWLEYKLTETSESAVIHKIMGYDALTSKERRIIDECLQKPFNVSFKELINTTSWLQNKELCEALRKPLIAICANYLYYEKKRGYAYDPVANFHLRNGATLWRLNWMADISRKGALSSLGMMVNYKYNLDEVDENSRQYFLRGHVALSKEFGEVLRNK